VAQTVRKLFAECIKIVLRMLNDVLGALDAGADFVRSDKGPRR